ncbi:Gryzun, putative trafficking through golgi-domain-containing protein [Dichotomocladium elegans]|nr:Gryzun, putative trafficking through golgi-domain-containing protein [Dichotomocladium elegans]
MNTYPAEYVLHPVPVLGVYGLIASAPQVQSDDASDGNTNPAPDTIDAEKEASRSTSRPPVSSRNTLGTTLRSIFTNKQHFSLQEAARYQSAHGMPGNTTPPFRVVFIEKDFVLPERQSIGPQLPLPHSALSPLSTESPLHPDGIMTPLWIKKQLDTPSAIVGFYDLWDWSNDPNNQQRPKRETGPLAPHLLIDPTEREHDTMLAHEINERRKYFQDKGIKFAAVIVLKRQQTDKSADPGVEERLSLIRKQAGLDNKLSFFTVSPGTQHDMQEFVNSVYRALYESAINYYNNRIKMVRKKRAKLPPASASTRLSTMETNEPQPLPIQGWMLRYDFKTAFFQEIRQDIDGATKSYESAYTLVADMLAPKSSITPGLTGLPLRGKRWEEARALIDCINIKICKFYLYLNEPVAALAQFNGHLHMLQSYCATWGMGDQSFEYWSWLSKQYRVFADIVDNAAQHGFKIPTPTSYLNSPAGVPGNPLMPTPTSLGGCNPGTILQHPGFYYHLAAMCSAERRRRFLAVEKTEDAKDTSTAWGALLAAERQVDHSNLTIDLFTKSYEQFKKYRNTRMTLYLAAEIAGTYYETGKFEMALKFFERIGKTYRKENWHMVLASILRWSLRCAKELGSWERAVECLVELLSSDLPMSDHKRQDIQKELWDILHRDGPAVTTLEIQMDQVNPLLTCHFQFITRTNFVNTTVPFQVSLKTGATSPPLPLRFSAMRVLFSNPRYNMLITDNNSDGPLDSVVHVDCTQGTDRATVGEYTGWVIKKADLRVVKNQIKVFEGNIIPSTCEELKIIGISLDIRSPYWRVSLNYDLDRITVKEHDESRRKWLEPAVAGSKPKFRILDGRGDLNTIKISQRPPRVKLSAKYAPQALLNEYFEMIICIENMEKDPIDASLRVEIKDATGHGQETSDHVVLTRDIPTTKQNIQETSIGRIEPGASSHKTAYLCADDLPGTRIVTLTTVYTSANASDASQSAEKREIYRIPFKAPFENSFKVSAQSDKLPSTTSFLNLQKSEKWLVSAAIRCCAATDLEIAKVEFEEAAFEHPSTSLTLLSDQTEPSEGLQVWSPAHVYNISFMFRMATDDITEVQPTVPVGSLVVRWRRSGHDVAYSKTTMAMPTLELRQPELSILADVPKDMYVGEPFTVTYTLHNPTAHLAEYTGSVELSDAFVFSGLKLLKGRVLPLSRVTYNYTCYPLSAGRVRLPRLKIVAKQRGVDKEVPLEILDEQRLKADPEQWPPPFVFVNARRYF